MSPLAPHKLGCYLCSEPMLRLGFKYWFCIACRVFVVRKPSTLKPGEGDCV